MRSARVLLKGASIAPQFRILFAFTGRPGLSSRRQALRTPRPIESTNAGTWTDDAGRPRPSTRRSSGSIFWNRRPAATSRARAIRSRPAADAGNSICWRRPRGCSRATESPRRRWPTSPPRPVSPCRRSTTIIPSKEDLAYEIPIRRLAQFYAEFLAQARPLATMRERLHLFLSHGDRLRASQSRLGTTAVSGDLAERADRGGAGSSRRR